MQKNLDTELSPSAIEKLYYATPTSKKARKNRKFVRVGVRRRLSTATEISVSYAIIVLNDEAVASTLTNSTNSTSQYAT
jgi:hypothetical protein